MGRTKSIHTEDEEVPKKHGRQCGAKSCNKSTFKIISRFKPLNMVVYGVTVAEQYLVACGELEYRRPAVIKKFVSRKCETL